MDDTSCTQITCSGSTWQNMEIFSLTEFSSAVVQRHMICEQRSEVKGCESWSGSTLGDQLTHQIGGQTQTSELSDAVLGRFGLLLSGGAGLKSKPKDEICFGRFPDKLFYLRAQTAVSKATACFLMFLSGLRGRMQKKKPISVQII